MELTKNVYVGKENEIERGFPKGSIYVATDTGRLFMYDSAGVPFSYEQSTSGDIAGSYIIDWNKGVYWDLTMTANTTFVEINTPVAPNGKTIAIRLTGSFTATLPASWNIDLTSYDGAVDNLITVTSFGTDNHFGSFKAGS